MIWRLLQVRHLERWRGRDENMAAGQQAVYHRSRRNRAASFGAFSEDMEAAAAFASAPPPNQYFSGMNLNG